MSKMNRLDISIRGASWSNQEYEELSFEINTYLHEQKSFEELSLKSQKIISDFKN